MDREIRTICYDETLRIEAYRLKGGGQAFPNHFHEHYVLGLLERGAYDVPKPGLYPEERGCGALLPGRQSRLCPAGNREPG